jgi:excinuclease UvrABC ATPase subunit
MTEPMCEASDVGQKCPQCSFNGFDPTGYAMQDPDCEAECPRCHGTRWVPVEQDSPV